MGYRSDVRVILPEEEFNAMDARLKALGDGYDNYQVKQFRIENAEQSKTPKRYVYFGWDYVKWYEYDDDYPDVKIVNEAVSESDDCHFIRYGEDSDDFEETYNLQGDIECIKFSRGFEDEEEKPPCPHCSKPFSETTLIYRNGDMLVNATIDFCPKCGKKINGGNSDVQNSDYSKAG
ncbi:MAG: hypothetical protein FWH03_05435 [Firmicutes bacterium]|nr:hypothetical protein [Bacillota bacterium]